MLISIALAFTLAGAVYLTHPTWFTEHSSYSLLPAQITPSPGPTAAPVPTRPRPVVQQARIGTVQHLDDIWITPYVVDHSQGTKQTAPNIGDEFLVVHLRIRNRSQVDYRVTTDDFRVLDGHGVLDPPLTADFTRLRLRDQVQLIPQGYIDGTLVFEVPLHDDAARLLYRPEVLDPSKRKEWLLR